LLPRRRRSFAERLGGRTAPARAMSGCSHVCHSSLSRVRVALHPERGPVARCECGESERPEHWDRHPTGAPRQRTLPGTRLHSGARTCSPPLAAASRTELPDAPERRRARAPPRVLATWPAARLVARARCAGVRLE
jgi:hypothetical protein